MRFRATFWSFVLCALFSLELSIGADPSAAPHLANHQNRLDQWNLKGATACEILNRLVAGSARLAANESAYRTVREAYELLKTDPKQAYEKVLLLYAKCQACFERDFPDLAAGLGKATGHVNRDLLRFLSRVNDILFAASSPQYNRDLIWMENEGISGFLDNGLILDETYLDIVDDFQKKLRTADSGFKQKLDASRKERGVPIMDADGPVDYLVGDPSSRELSSFDPIPEMIQSVRQHLPPQERSDPKKVREYVFKLLLIFHDDVSHWKNGGERYLEKEAASSKERADIFYATRQETPIKHSIMYTNWSGVEENKVLDAIQKVERKMEELTGKRGYRLQAFRAGNYHYNAAAAIYGLATEGLFDSVPGSDRAISLVQGKMAAVYKGASQHEHRDPIQAQVFDYLQERHPELTKKFLDGKLTLPEITGPTGASSAFAPSLFDDLLGNHNGELTLLAKRFNQSPEALKKAILEEQVLWLQSYRTIQQHKAGRQIAEKIKKAIEEELRAHP